MKKRYIVLLDSNATKAQSDAFLNFIKQCGDFGYWHWLGDSWLLYSTNPEHTVQYLRSKVAEFFPSIHHMVLEFRDDGTDNWQGFGPNAEGRNMFEWMHTNWKK